MSEAINTAGPAFPLPAYLDAEDGSGTRLIVMASEGTTLRDYFAIRVLQALLTGSQAPKNKDDWARIAYEMADAMIKERARP